MWFRKFFVGVLLVCGVSVSLIAEDNDSMEFALLKANQYAKVAGDASKFIFEAGQSLDLVGSPLENTILNKLLSRQIESYQYMNELDIEYAKLVKEGYRQPYELSRIRQNKVEILDYIKEKRKTYTTKDISLFQLSDGVKKILGVSLDVIGIGLDAYSFNQNINKLIDEDGNVLVNSLGISQNVYGMVSGSVSLLSKVAKDGVIASSKFGKFFTNASKGFNRTNYIVMTLQLNSVAYSYFRDKELNSTKEYAIKEYKSILGFRKDIYSQLLTAYTNDSNISRGEIGTILSKYPIFRPNNSGFLETTILSKVFHKNISNPIYLKKRFDIDSESDLTGFQRVVVALDSLAHINLYEDDDFVRRLTKMMDAFPDDNWLAGLENAVAGAFSGADAYKIFSISDLKKKFIPSELVRDSNIDAYTFYKVMYYNIFRGDIASAWMQTANDIGKVASDFIETSIKEEEISNNTPKLLLTLPEGATIANNQIKANQGDTISFYPDITAGSLRECISNAGEGATYTLGYYETNNQANKKSLLLDFDSSTQTFSFTMPSSEIALLDLYYGSGDTTQSCGVVSVSANSNNTGNGQNTLNDVEWIQKIKAKDYIDGNYNYGHCDIGKVVMTDSLGNVFVSGNTLGGLDGNNTQNGNELIFLGKFTANGEKLWIKQYGRVGEHYEVHSMIIDSDDNIYISGWIGFGGMDARPLLYKFNKNGILLWKNELPMTYEDESQNEIQLIEDGIILVSDRSGRQSGDKNHIVIRKFSLNGNLLWTKNIEEDKITYFKAITTDNKNSYILGNKLLDSTPGNIIYEPIVYKVDSNGNQLNKTILDTNQSIVVNNITLYKNDFYLIGLEHLEGNNYTHHLFKMDIDGKTIWRTELNKEQKYNYYGNSLEIYNDIIYSIGAKAVWLSKYTLNGTLLESKNYLPLADVMSGVGGEALTVGLDDEVYIVGNGKDKSSSNGYSSLLFKVSNDTRSSKIGQNINLISETQLDNTIVVDSFTKEWRFSQDISGLTISVLGNSYQNSVTGNDFIKDGQILKVNLTPNQSSFQNKLILQFTDTNGNLVKVNGSETFWSLTKTNHAPRLADGQITQLVSSSSEPATLEIATYDSDGDSVTLSVEDSAGGTVALNGNRITASFSDGKVAHTIKIGLSDGKEKVIKAFTVLQFNQNAIESFYSDVDTNSSDYAFEGIAFGTLNGVIGGQIDPNDSSKRIFRPRDSASLAEALKMIINAEAKAGLIELTTADRYMQSYPTWAMKYYTFARESGAMDKEILDLSTVYQTREAIARMLVKTLNLDSKIEAFGELNFTFSDEDKFSDAQMRHYAEIAHVFGLFMLDDQAKPQAQISRAELAGVIQRIFMIPKAELLLNPVSVEQGEGNITATLSSIVAQDINSSNHKLYDSSDEVTVSVTSNSQRLTNPVDSEALHIGENSIYAFIDNHGVRGLAEAVVDVTFRDQDSDGIQDRDDQWSDDARYRYDANGNGVPDILESIYDSKEYAEYAYREDRNCYPYLTLSLDATTYTVTEGESFTIYINKTPGACEQQVSASIKIDTTGSTAKENRDYKGYHITSVVNTDTNTTGFRIDTKDDSISEADETFTITLSSPIGATLGTSSATVTITDDGDADADSDGDGIGNSIDKWSSDRRYSLDSDDDNLPDEWEIMNFGDTTTADANSDSDGDGYSDLVEFQDSLNQNNPLSSVSNRVEAKRRIPPIIETLHIPEEMNASDTYTLKVRLVGYDSDYAVVVAMFDCSNLPADSCGGSFNDDSRFHYETLSNAGSISNSSWSYSGQVAHYFDYEYAFTVPSSREDGTAWSNSGTDIVVRFYQKTTKDADAGINSVSLFVPGNITNRYYDSTGRRILKTICPSGGCQ